MIALWSKISGSGCVLQCLSEYDNVFCTLFWMQECHNAPLRFLRMPLLKGQVPSNATTLYIILVLATLVLSFILAFSSNDRAPQQVMSLDPVKIVPLPYCLPAGHICQHTHDQTSQGDFLFGLMAIAISVQIFEASRGSSGTVTQGSLWSIIVQNQFLAKMSVFGHVHAINLSIMFLSTDILQWYCRPCAFKDIKIYLMPPSADAACVGGAKMCARFARCVDNENSGFKKCLDKEPVTGNSDRLSKNGEVKEKLFISRTKMATLRAYWRYFPRNQWHWGPLANR